MNKQFVGPKGIVLESSWKWWVQSGHREGSFKKFYTGERIGQQEGVEQEEMSCKFLQEHSSSVRVK